MSSAPSSSLSSPLTAQSASKSASPARSAAQIARCVSSSPPGMCGFFSAGASIGATAANVPLSIAAAPFVARMVEQSLEEIDAGVVEAARCMGATNWQIITRVLLVESVPSLLRGLSITIITIFGYTAVTGAVGAGGLGNIAFRFGYQRYQSDVMYATIVLVVILVCIIQSVCNLLARKADKRNR